MQRVAVALFLCVPLASTAWMWVDDSRSPAVPDPIVRSVHVGERMVRTTAVFSPRLRIDESVTYSHAFELANDGAVDLVVDRTSKSCSCLSGEISSNRIAPGEKALVTLHVRPDTLINKEATFTVSTMEGHQYVFELKTRTYPFAMLEGPGGHGATISFGLTEPGGTLSTRRRLVLYSMRGISPPQLRLLQPAEATDELLCSMADRGVESVGNGELLCRVYDLDVAVTGTCAGLHSNELQFASTDPRRNEYDFKVRVIWNVDAPISIKPQRWVVRRESAGTSNIRVQSLRLQSPKGRTFAIRRVEAPQPLAVELSTHEASEWHDVTLSLDMDAVPRGESFLGIVRFHLGPESTLQGKEDDQKEIMQTFHVTVMDDDS